MLNKETHTNNDAFGQLAQMGGSLLGVALLFGLLWWYMTLLLGTLPTTGF